MIKIGCLKSAKVLMLKGTEGTSWYQKRHYGNYVPGKSYTIRLYRMILLLENREPIIATNDTKDQIVLVTNKKNSKFDLMVNGEAFTSHPTEENYPKFFQGVALFVWTNEYFPNESHTMLLVGNGNEVKAVSLTNEGFDFTIIESAIGMFINKLLPEKMVDEDTRRTLMLEDKNN